ncbi:FAD-dependent oxidoreductase [Roseitranquillus sediminis]|uniref:FAD-dependent oxidoreductase n=1 Tax=Roseitranquillus sediminis TaxID=2809051 RepID=UPI001D0CBEF5|nr:FAD-dependent monooxygenase [Roseitranquillus sediminis]MBM9594456.1 FAD-dependent monooxygenase [Roseitranquillus sediminis]
MTEKDRVIISGGGPVGLICALGLARQDVPVTVLERNEDLLDDPRAATTHPATLELLDELGLEEEVRAAGLVAPVFQFWDRTSGELIAEFDHALLSEETRFPYVVQCEQFKTARIALSHLQREPNAEVLFGHEVTGIAEGEDGVTVTVRNGERSFTRTTPYLVGADGGRSLVRKSAGIEFEGFTFLEQFLVLTTPFDFQSWRGYSYRSYFADPQEWCNCFKVAADGPPGLWRTVYPTDPQQQEDDLLSDAAVQARLQKFFPKDGDYEVVHRNLYRVHQRVAKTFRKKRVLLAGDAAHVNNPIGGMGLNGGIQDAVNLAGKLAEVWQGRATDALLDLYDLQRRTVTTEFVQAQTIQNKKRLEARDEATRQANFRDLRETAGDPERAKAFLMRASMLDAERRAAALGAP